MKARSKLSRKLTSFILLTAYVLPAIADPWACADICHSQAGSMAYYQAQNAASVQRTICAGGGNSTANSVCYLVAESVFKQVYQSAYEGNYQQCLGRCF